MNKTAVYLFSISECNTTNDFLVAVVVCLRARIERSAAAAIANEKKRREKQSLNALPFLSCFVCLMSKRIRDGKL